MRPLLRAGEPVFGGLGGYWLEEQPQMPRSFILALDLISESHRKTPGKPGGVGLEGVLLGSCSVFSLRVFFSPRFVFCFQDVWSYGHGSVLQVH